MKKAIIFAVLTMMTAAGSVFADVKIKSRQTASGQTTENTTYIKGKRQRTEMMDGVMVSITQCDLRRDVQLAPATKTYTVSYYTDANGNPTVPVTQGASAPVTKGGIVTVTTTIRDTGERKQMFGYTARHIIQTMEMESSPDACSRVKNKMEMDMWVIDAEFGLACTQNNYGGYNTGKAGGCQDKFVPKTIGTGKSGYPVYQKMTSFDESGKESFSMVQEVVELSKTTLDASLFEVPSDYREVKDASQMYTSMSTSGDYGSNAPSYDAPSANTNPSLPSSNGLSSTISKTAAPQADAPASVGAKKPGTVRIGLANVKTGAVGDGISAADLGAAVRNTLGEFMKGTKVEIVPLEARLASAQADEAKQKECDYVIVANVSHKKGGGGFGGFGRMLSSVAPVMGVGGIAGQVAASAIITAASVSGNMKSKDEITLDIKLQSAADNSSALAQQFKAKAKSDGDDIISTVAEQAAQAIINTVGK